MNSTHPEPPVLPLALVEAWRADAATLPELRRGYARFTRRRPVANALLSVARLVAFGIVLGVGLAQAASLVQRRWFAAELQVTLPPSQSSVRAPTLVASSAHAAPTVSPVAAPSEAVHVVGVVSGRPLAPAPAFAQEQWQRAALALRDHDFARAEAAFIQIERSVGGAEGDAARLARAQLLASYGRTAEAQTLASDLQDHAQSALVRGKARALLTTLTKIDVSHRSIEPTPAINQP